MTRLALLVALLVACGSKKQEDQGPSCDKVVDHMLDLTKQMLPGHGDQPMGDRNAMIEQCVQRKMPASMRSCLVAAKSLDDLAACRRAGKPSDKPVQPPAQPPAPAPDPVPTRPLPTESAAPGSAG